MFTFERISKCSKPWYKGFEDRGVTMYHPEADLRELSTRHAYYWCLRRCGSTIDALLCKKKSVSLLHAHRGIQDLQALVDRLDFSHPPHLFQTDLGEPEEIQTLCEKAMAVHGSVDVLVNNAGSLHLQPSAGKPDPSEWDRVLSVNLTAPFLMSKRVASGHAEKGFRRIVNISSIVAQTGAVGTAAYAASKAGLFGLSASMARELAPKAIKQ